MQCSVALYLVRKSNTFCLDLAPLPKLQVNLSAKSPGVAEKPKNSRLQEDLGGMLALSGLTE